MNPIEKEFNKRYKDQELSNKGFDNEGLWAAISEEIHDKPITESPSKTFTKGSILGLTLLGFFLASSFIYFINQKNNPIEKTSTIVFEKTSSNTNQQLTNEESITKEITEINNSENSIIDTKELNKVSNNKNTENIILSQTSTPNSSVNNESTIPKRNENISKRAINFSDTKAVQNIIQTSTSSEAFIESSNINSSIGNNIYTIEKIETTSINASPFSDSEITNNQAKENLKSVENNNLINESSNSINLISNKLLPTYSSFLAINNKLEDEKEYPHLDIVDFRKTKNIQWQIALLGGINVPDFKFTSTNSTEWTNLKNDYESALIASSFGLQTSLILREKWLIGTGLELHDMWTKFDYVNKRNFTVLKENELVAVQINSMGDTINRIYADTLVNGVETRTVRNYNHYKSISIPLNFGIQHTHNRWTYGISLGPVVHFQTKQQGVSFDLDSELSIFRQTENTAPLKKINLGFRAAPFVSYNFKNRLSFIVKPTVNWQGNTLDANRKVNLYQYNLNIGIVYKR